MLCVVTVSFLSCILFSHKFTNTSEVNVFKNVKYLYIGGFFFLSDLKDHIQVLTIVCSYFTKRSKFTFPACMCCRKASALSI